MKRIFLIALTSLISIPMFSQEEIKGVWLTQEGNTKVEIYQKDDQHYSGKVVWLKKPANKKGEPQKDKMNPDKSLRNRTIMGIDLLENLVYKNGKWHGTIYSPKRGKTLDAVVRVNESGFLQINVTYLSFSRQQEWKRAELTE